MTEPRFRRNEEGHIRSLLREAGAIGYCELHEGVVIDNCEPDAVESARDAALAEITSGVFVLPAGASLSELIQRVMDGIPEDCPSCEATLARD
ncbi:hypothetical protein [Reyranella sp.]|uniref:hypothetical protein n=1 Tax=Reyranella sp. TaxID=1929291 RepID=UPI002716A4A8|nr:hypothetical protein [Reyranella sp.]MDO8977544.1 hypothetical protein [Reyranella sp.]